MLTKISSFIISIVMFIASLFGICPSKPKPASDFEIDCKGSTVTFNITENPSTGYKWSYEASDDKILSLVDDDYTPSQFADVAGAAGTRTFVFNAENAGKALLRFSYARSWEPDAPAQTVLVFVNVADDMTVSAAVVSNK